MKVFTYKEYIKYIHTFRLNAVMQLAEESEEYKLEQTIEKNYSHDKLIKNILQNKKEVAQFINQFVEPREDIREEQLVRYTNSYITKKYKSKEADLVYRIKDQEIFYLIEHQSTKDNNMPFRILNYCLDIMREWSRNRKIWENTYYPIIVPIVIYTGNQKWEMPKNFKDVQYDDYTYEEYKIGLEYNFVDINKFSKHMLLKNHTMFSYAMLIEKARNYKELVENLDIIINQTSDNEILDELSNIINYLLENVLEEKIQQQLLEKIERKVGDSNMSELIDRLKKEGEERRRQEYRKEVAKNMLDKNLDEKIIIETTGIQKKDLEEIKSKLSIVDNA